MRTNVHIKHTDKKNRGPVQLKETGPINTQKLHAAS